MQVVSEFIFQKIYQGKSLAYGKTVWELTHYEFVNVGVGCF